MIQKYICEFSSSILKILVWRDVIACEYVSETNKKHPEKYINQLGCSNKLQTSALFQKESSSPTNCFNSFFSTIATQLVNKLPPHSGLYGSDHIQAHYENLGAQKDAFSFNPVRNEEVLKKIDHPSAKQGH